MNDFNNLLTVVLVFFELLLVGKDGRDPSYADLQKILHSARSGADLTKSILTFSREVKINPRPLNLNHEIEQAKKLLTRTIAKMLEVELVLSDGLAAVNADSTQVEQVLMNLSVNASHAMPGGGRLTIGTQPASLDEECCRLSRGEVRYTPPSALEKLTIQDTTAP